jgi:hypothetical protein
VLLLLEEKLERLVREVDNVADLIGPVIQV